MVKYCPPGVICIENYTIIFIIIFMIFIAFVYKINFSTNQPIINNYTNENSNSGLFPKPSYSFSNISEDVLLNPYQPPLRDERYINFDTNYNNRIPINIQTQSVDTNYRQVGILTRNSTNETILPLMGRPLFTNRDKWNFYTMNDKNNMIKLPISFKGKSATNEYGIDNLYNNDNVYVEGYNDTFKVTMYDNQVMRYIPFF